MSQAATRLDFFKHGNLGTVELSINGYYFTLIKAKSSNSIVVANKCQLNFEIGTYLSNIVFIINDEVQHFSGIVSGKDKIVNSEYEIGLLQELPLELYTEAEFLEGIMAFKTKTQHSEARKSARVSVRKEDGLNVDVSLNGHKLKSRLYDISSFGLSFISSVEISKDTELEFSVQLKNDIFSGHAVVSWVREVKKDFYIGLVFKDFSNRPQPKGLKNIIVRQEFAIRGVFSRVNFYFERSSFKVLSLSSKNMVLELDKSDQFILPGMKLDLKFFLSSMNYIDIDPTILEVIEVKEGNGKTLIVNGNIKLLNPDLSLNISNYLLQFLDVNPTELRDSGFEVTKIADAFSFRYVETHEDYLEVLKLRYMAYSLAGKVKGDKTPKDMIAGLDAKSRILIMKHQGRTIASAAISFPDSEDIVLDTERALAGGYPASIPKKCDMIEISRLCTHPDYRKGDMLHRIFEHTYKIFVMSGRKHIITSCDDKLWPLYKKLGFRKTGQSYPHPSLEGLIHHLIILPVEVCLKVNKVGFLAWGYLYNSIFTELESKKLVNVDRHYRFKMYLATMSYKIISKIYSLIKGKTK